MLYYGGEAAQIQSLMRAMAGSSSKAPMLEPGPLMLRHGEMEIAWIAEREGRAARRCLQRMYVNLLVLDLRWSEDFDARLDDVRSLLSDLDHADDLEQRYGFHRILVLLSGPDSDRIDTLIAELGRLGVQHVLRERRPDGDYRPSEDEESTRFALRVLERAAALMADRHPGSSALCASGGGITGIYFEVGALKCLDDCLEGKQLNDFDMFFGISAGAVVTSLLSVGYTIDEMMAAIAGAPGGRLPPLNLSLLRLGHLNREDIRWRARSAARTARNALWDFIRGRGRPSADSLFLEYTSLVGPPFQSGEFEKMLREVLDVPGGTNAFPDLPRPLYIGASDQDGRSPVLFGAEGFEDVPISVAVQASLSVNPAFASVPINGRYYEDGAITRTSNFVEAIRRDAKLLMIFDPFVPYIAKVPGTAHRRGMLYNIDQDIRTMSFTRFERTRDLVLRKHPEVSSYTFLPSNTSRQLLSTNPMDHRPFLPIWKDAYLSTLQRIVQLCHRMRGDFVDHGMRIDTSRAEAVAERLRHTSAPTLADFFPEGRVELSTHPMLE